MAVWAQASSKLQRSSKIRQILHLFASKHSPAEERRLEPSTALPFKFHQKYVTKSLARQCLALPKVAKYQNDKIIYPTCQCHLSARMHWLSEGERHNIFRLSADDQWLRKLPFQQSSIKVAHYSYPSVQRSRPRAGIPSKLGYCSRSISNRSRNIVEPK